MSLSKKINKFPTVSVIIPAYNAEKSIAHCLHALQEQSIHANEIIIVDDGSSDETKSIAEKFKKVKVLSQKNQGPAIARNNGSKSAKGEIIIFLDSDCVPERNWLEKMIQPFNEKNVIGVQGAYKTKQKSLIARFDQLDIEYRYERMKRIPKLDWIGSYSAAYRKEIFLSEGGFDETFPKASGEDAEFSYRLAEKGHLLVFAPRAIVYHTHPETLWKYLNVKFFRAYWRMRMYLKHPQKMVKDSYTPQTLKLSIIYVIAATILALAFGIGIMSTYFSTVDSFAKEVIFGFLIGIIFTLYMIGFISMPYFFLFVLRNDFMVGILTPFIVILRAISFGLGMLNGLLDKRVRA